MRTYLHFYSKMLIPWIDVKMFLFYFFFIPSSQFHRFISEITITFLTKKNLIENEFVKFFFIIVKRCVELHVVNIDENKRFKHKRVSLSLSLFNKWIKWKYIHWIIEDCIWTCDFLALFQTRRAIRIFL